MKKFTMVIVMLAFVASVNAKWFWQSNLDVAREELTEKVFKGLELHKPMKISETGIVDRDGEWLESHEWDNFGPNYRRDVHINKEGQITAMYLGPYQLILNDAEEVISVKQDGVYCATRMTGYNYSDGGWFTKEAAEEINERFQEVKPFIKAESQKALSILASEELQPNLACHLDWKVDEKSSSADGRTLLTGFKTHQYTYQQKQCIEIREDEEHNIAVEIPGNQNWYYTFMYLPEEVSNVYQEINPDKMREYLSIVKDKLVFESFPAGWFYNMRAENDSVTAYQHVKVNQKNKNTFYVEYVDFSYSIEYVLDGLGFDLAWNSFEYNPDDCSYNYMRIED